MLKMLQIKKMMGIAVSILDVITDIRLSFAINDYESGKAQKMTGLRQWTTAQVSDP